MNYRRQKENYGLQVLQHPPPADGGRHPFPKDPGESITTIVNFEEGRTYCKDIDRPAWGYIEYTAPLDQQQVSDYELVQAPQEADHE